MYDPAAISHLLRRSQPRRLGIPKRVEWFLFFKITNVDDFKKYLKELIPAITTSTDIAEIRNAINDHKNEGKQGLIRVSGINLAFSNRGIQTLGIDDDLTDPSFTSGQLARAQALGDQGQIIGDTFDVNWIPAFKGGDIDGLAGDCEASVVEAFNRVTNVLGNSFKEVLKVKGGVRPGKEKGHEHFGFLNGISQPAILSVTPPPFPGQAVVDPGIIIVGATGDPNLSSRPSWAVNGSFLVYRQLNQLVPEFSKFLVDNPIHEVGLPPAEGSELLGARFVGRWKSGAPVALAPTHDDPELAADKQRNNNFDFSEAADQTNCPFAAHIRKTNPRSDLSRFGPSATLLHSISRQSIPFGPEVTPEEYRENKTHCDRGLSFVCYQSVLANGFEFMQARANNIHFPVKQVVPGFDPIIGQNGNDTRTTQGSDPTAQSNSLSLPFEFVVSKGGEYFFSPSITALKTKFAA
ncbi:Dyp-type peroxidase [Rickenella mellea]|uniref:Dyp-type peroxidase n=1 Tax=Rickenella mellea TaxID=50990 RepID=A0A4Y7PNN2_9AGAM|nr:Dyp-type peroxidase [Rickenella mellea]